MGGIGEPSLAARGEKYALLTNKSGLLVKAVCCETSSDPLNLLSFQISKNR